MITKNKIKFKNILNGMFLLVGFLLFNACSKDDGGSDGNITVEVTTDDTDFTATDWTTETHSKEAEPNFDEVFSDTTVKRLDIVVTEDRWESMLDDMTNLYGNFGSGNGSFSDDDADPVFVPASVFYEDTEWYKVGIRFKGNSSLANTWADGNLKLSFKLDFDEFEDEYPQIDNQRFYGFKKLSLKNNYDDRSMLREKVATDVFRNAGLAASHTAFYTVYVDYGDGPQYFGVYTLVEEIDDTVLAKLEKLSHLHIDENKKEEVKSQLTGILDYIENIRNSKISYYDF